MKSRNETGGGGEEAREAREARESQRGVFFAPKKPEARSLRGAGDHVTASELISRAS